jgi:hypothetical protein
LFGNGRLVAWLKPKILRSQNTGHVAILVHAPLVRAPGDSAYLLRVADSSRLMHEDDTRHGRGGYGIGTILLDTDPKTGSPTGFSFAGSRATHAWGSRIVIARPLK